MPELQARPHSIPLAELFEILEVSERGLNPTQVQDRFEVHGPNLLPTKEPPTLLHIFLHQFLNPLIYILAIAALISISLGDFSDAIFIALVLFVNAVIGTIQEYSAEKSAQALNQMAASMCIVERDGEIFEIDAKTLVPGDIVLLESGKKVPADLRLIASHGLEIDESLLTGESHPVLKDHDLVFAENTSLADRKNMAFTGSLVTRGRARGIVTTIGFKTELGKIADSISSGLDTKPPLVVRMERFTRKIAISLILVTMTMAVFLLLKGQSWHEVLMFSVALTVSAIPEGLPVALTIALAIASRRMSKRNVIVRRLPAVEALGSCSFIATDKTGTLTVNQLTIKKIIIQGLPEISIEGSGLNPKGAILFANDLDERKRRELLDPIVTSGVLCNEANLAHRDGSWSGHGDTVDLALLVLAHKSETNPNDIRIQYSLVNDIPFEPENQYAATLHSNEKNQLISIKGALEKLLPMCSKMAALQGEVELDVEAIISQADQLAESGYRVLALAKKESHIQKEPFEEQLHDLTFLCLVGMIDPLRDEAMDAVHSCHRAGITVAMVTGDHPKTALAIARELGLATDINKVVTGPQLKAATSPEKKAHLIEKARVFARVEPQQKLEIVRFLLDQGQFVAVTGDGANDAPALKSANVGVAMGKSGTDIAKETSDLIITDDRFASIVAGIEEGRIAYSNVRKVVYLLISTGAAEILLFSLSLFFDTPLPLTAVQVLWLNLVTNGIQDVGLAFEPGEGDELERPPRKPNEPVFDRLMLERIVLSATVIGIISFFYFRQLLSMGVHIDSARNLTLLLMVLFENVMIANCRSETKSVFGMNPFSNKVLLIGTIAAQLIHIGVLYTPGIREVLGVEPVHLSDWGSLFTIALSVLIAMEIYKKFRRKANNPSLQQSNVQ